MGTSGRFRLSLHISHPVLSAEEVAAPFALNPRYARSVGTARITNLGENLGGVYTQTDVSLAFSDAVVDNEDVLLADFVNQSITNLPLDAINRVVESGGSCFFLIGIYSENNILCDFDVKLLVRLAANRIGLKLDFYGGPE